jgi:pimeloyl-ACP methyl ester carboxylesterase
MNKVVSIPALIALLVLACGLQAGCVSSGRTSNAGPVQEASFVPIGGIEQWVTIRGANRSNPILLIVHGGPADTQSQLIQTYAPYERNFVVVQWDQRGAGKTFGRNRDTVKELGLERMALDGIELADYLRTHLGQDKVVLLGHSWGTILATDMVKRKPESFAAYVGTGQVASWRAAVTAQWSYLRTAATAANDQATLDRMNAIGAPDPYNVGQYFSWRNIMNRSYLTPADAGWLQALRTMSTSSGMTDAEKKEFTEAGSFSATQLLKVMMTTDLGVTAKQMPVPFFVIQGRADMYTPTQPAIDYFNSVQAPRKQLIVIEDAGHFALATHQEEFLQALRTAIKSL